MNPAAASWLPLASVADPPRLSSGVASLLGICLTAALAYVALVLVLRLAGKRTLSKWNAFDFVVTVALGSCLATVVLSRDVPLVDGVVAFTVLVALQLAVTWLASRWPWFERGVKARPSLLLFRGELLEEAMRRQRVPASEILAALRSKGVGTYDDVYAVVLETDGSFSVLAEAPSGTRSTMGDVAGWAERGASSGDRLG